jgi:hypothetical protein
MGGAFTIADLQKGYFIGNTGQTTKTLSLQLIG